MAIASLLGTVTWTTTVGTKTVTATPAVGDQIFLVTAHSGFTTTTTAPTDNNPDGLGAYTVVASALKNASADLVQIWRRNSLIGNASSTVFTHAPASSTGGGVGVIKVTGIPTAGASVVIRSGTAANQSSGTTPTVTLSAAASASSVIIGAVFSTTNGVSVTERTGYTEQFDAGYNTPTSGLEIITRNSGETGSSIAWGSTVPSAYGAIVVEINAPAVGAAAGTGSASGVGKSVAVAVGSASGSGTATATPASLQALFSGGVGGVWYDPSDLSTLFQSGTRASPGPAVTADGDPVGLVLDKSGNNNDLVQATSTKRPLYKTSGSLSWLQFDGIDDCLQTSAALDLSAYGQLGTAIGFISSSAATQVLAELGADTNGAVAGTFYLAAPNDPSAGRISMAINGTGAGGIDAVATTAATYGSGVTSVLSFQSLDVTVAAASSRLPLRRNGAAEPTTVVADGGGAGTVFSGTQLLNVGARNGGAAFPLAGDLYGLIIRGGAFSTGELATVEQYETGAAGLLSTASVGSASATGSATGVGQSLITATGSASGTSAASGVGASSAVAAGSSSGTGSASAVGTGVVPGVGAASGTGSATGAGTAAIVAAGAASGTSAASAIGASLGKGTGSSAGTGAASSTGQSQALAAGSAAGTGAASGVGRSTALGVGTSTGIGAATGTGGSLATGVGSAAGTGTATGASSSPGAPSVGSAAGSGSAAAVGASTAFAAGSANGTSSASATGSGLGLASGTSSATGSASVVGSSLAAGQGASQAVSSATAAGKSTASAVGSSAGSGAANANGTGIVAAVGSSSGVSTASGIGKAFVTGVGLSAGFGVVVGAGQSIAEAAGVAEGQSTAVAVGRVGSIKAFGPIFKLGRETLPFQPGDREDWTNRF